MSDPIHSRYLTQWQARSLYVSHILSSWNARSYEFAVILFTAEAWKGTLLMSSLRGLITTLMTLLVSTAIGAGIDNSQSRLRPLLLSICINRVSVVVACIGWFFLLRSSSYPGGESSYSPGRILLFVFVVLAGVFERLSFIGNVISMERDWVPVLADPVASLNQDGEMGKGYTLTHLNAVMRRIDLICKLVAPLVISGIIEASSITVGVKALAGLSAICCGIEIVSAAHVWKKNPRLREPRDASERPSETAGPTTSEHPVSSLSTTSRLKRMVVKPYNELKSYFSTQVWIISLALSLLHLSALSYSATFLTYLLNTGLSLLVITVARAVGSVLEVLSTFVAPLAVRLLEKHREIASLELEERGRLLLEQEVIRTSSPELRDAKDGEERHLVGLARTGLWGITMQFACLLPVVLTIVQFGTKQSHLPNGQEYEQTNNIMPPTVAVTVFAFLSLSRIGLWTYDLAATETTQILVPAQKRSAFAGTESSFVAFFELLQWILAAALNAPDQFKWLALVSLGAVATSMVLVAGWVRSRRGHLLHLDRLRKLCLREGKDVGT